MICYDDMSYCRSQLGEIGPNVQPRVIQDHKTELGLTWKGELI